MKRRTGNSRLSGDGAPGCLKPGRISGAANSGFVGGHLDGLRHSPGHPYARLRGREERGCFGYAIIKVAV